MTAQYPERLIYLGKKEALFANPLSMYFELADINPGFRSRGSANWRGYIGTWEILDERLYLIGLEGQFKDGWPATLGALFPEYPERVFAHWYSGILRVPQGSRLKYVHAGYASVFERDLLLMVRRGVVIDTVERHNTVPAETAQVVDRVRV